MRSRWRFAAFFFVLICVLLTQVESSDGREQAVALPDGSRIRLLGTTYGTTHRWVMGNAFSRGLLPLLPEWARGPQGDRWGEIETHEAESTVAWFMHDLGPRREPSVLATLYDDRGNEIPAKLSGYTVASGGLPKRRWMFAVQLTPEPLYSRFTGVHFWSSGSDAQKEPLAGFRIPRSRVGREKWDANPLPARRRVRDLDCALVSWEELTPLSTNEPPAWSKTRARVHLDVSRKGVPASDWWLSEVRVRDEAGGVIVPGVDWLERTGGPYYFDLMTGVWPDAAAYELEAGLYPMPDAVEAPIKVTRLLPVLPAGKQSFKPVQTINCNGIAVGVLRPIWNFGSPDLMLRFTLPYEPFPGYRIVVTKIVDDKGKTMPLGHPMQTECLRIREQGQVYSTCLVQTRFSEVPQSVTASFALVHGEAIRFRAKPKPWKPSSTTGSGQANRLR